MIFSSIPFLYYFLPCVLGLYYIVPKRLKNGVLFVSSLVFYAWGEPKTVFLMLVSILSAYLCGRLIQRYEGTGWADVSLYVGVGISLVLLLYFKYTGFFLDNLAGLLGVSAPVWKVALPIGISFYTFQIISYLIDVYRKTVPVQRNFISLGTYVVMFPQLIAGPVVRYGDIEKQLVERVHSVDKMAAGIRRFVLGMAKKVLIANALGEVCAQFHISGDQSVLYMWLYAVSFMLQIYYDFSGYSDMAIGLGRMFGFELMENFDYPYISTSVTEFWRRWHISLGSWFRDYVYIPMGGNRVPFARWLLNIFTVWFLTGFWHGAAWNFILWGLYFAVFLVIEKLWFRGFLKKYPLLAHVYTLAVVLIGFVIFNAESVSVAFTQIGSLCGLGGLPLISAESLYEFRSYVWILLLAVIGATPMVKTVCDVIRKHSVGEKLLEIAEPVVLIGLLLLMTAYFVDGSFNPFLYFRF